MKFVMIAGAKSTKESRKRILEAAKKYFDTVLFVPIEKIRIHCEAGKTKILFKNMDLTEFDVCYARFFGNDFVLGQIILDLLENSNVYTPNSVQGFQIANHKYYAVKVLSELNLPVPETGLSITPETALTISSKINFPLVVKLVAGFGGKGVMLSQSEKEFKPVLDTLKVFKEFVTIQKFIPNDGTDKRVYVFGTKTIGVERKAAKGDWRANVSRGGQAKIMQVTDKERQIAINAAKLLGLDICAVDFIKSDKGPVIIEINFAPGFIIKYFGSRFAREAMETMYKKALKKK